jgi:hypothetical protein
MATTHAVLDDQHMYLCQVVDGQRRMRRVQIGAPTNVGDVYQLARQHSITHMWAQPGSAVDVKDEEFYDTLPDGFNLFVAREDKNNPKSLATSFRVYKPGTYGAIYVGFPTRGRWQWDYMDPLDILSAVLYLEQVLGTTIQWSPNHVGMALVKKQYASDPKRQTWVRESEIDLNSLPFDRAAADVLWSCPLNPTDVGKWIHHYDKNSAYLSGCQGVSLGCGTPVHRINDINPDLAGIYRVSYTTGSNWDEALLPPIITTEWITRDLLKFAEVHGYTITIHEAYQFEESHQLLRPWASLLWDARAALKDANPEFPHEHGRLNAYYTIKEVALIGVGQFASDKFAHQFMRPNWWADVVSKARVTLLYNLTSFEDALNTPFMVYSDGLWFVSNTENPESAVPGILKRAGQLGGYKHVYSAMCTQEIVEKSQRLSQNPSKFVSYLHRCAGYR